MAYSGFAQEVRETFEDCETEKECLNLFDVLSNIIYDAMQDEIFKLKEKTNG